MIRLDEAVKQKLKDKWQGALEEKKRREREREAMKKEDFRWEEEDTIVEEIRAGGGGGWFHFLRPSMEVRELVMSRTERPSEGKHSTGSKSEKSLWFLRNMPKVSMHEAGTLINGRLVDWDFRDGDFKANAFHHAAVHGTYLWWKNHQYTLFL